MHLIKLVAVQNFAKSSTSRVFMRSLTFKKKERLNSIKKRLEGPGLLDVCRTCFASPL